MKERVVVIAVRDEMLKNFDKHVFWKIGVHINAIILCTVLLTSNTFLIGFSVYHSDYWGALTFFSLGIFGVIGLSYAKNCLTKAGEIVVALHLVNNVINIQKGTSGETISSEDFYR